MGQSASDLASDKIHLITTTELSPPPPPPSDLDGTLLFILVAMNGALFATAIFLVAYLWYRQRQLKVERSTVRRFVKFDRVVCNLGGGDGSAAASGTVMWASGTIQTLNAEDPYSPRSTVPYIVKIDPPAERLM
eukprot:5326998-Prymnesium_polylepis.1